MVRLKLIKTVVKKDITSNDINNAVVTFQNLSGLTKDECTQAITQLLETDEEFNTEMRTFEIRAYAAAFKYLLAIGVNLTEH
jgi:hypothetical protein